MQVFLLQFTPNYNRVRSDNELLSDLDNNKSKNSSDLI